MVRSVVRGECVAAWVVSSFDDRAHALAANGQRADGSTLCGLVVESSAAPAPAPSGPRVCGTCLVLAPGEPG